MAVCSRFGFMNGFQHYLLNSAFIAVHVVTGDLPIKRPLSTSIIAAGFGFNTLSKCIKNSAIHGLVNEFTPRSKPLHDRFIAGSSPVDTSSMPSSTGSLFNYPASDVNTRCHRLKPIVSGPNSYDSASPQAFSANEPEYCS